MVEVTDMTLLESEGEYETACKLMGGKKNTWMIQTKAFVSTPFISAQFLLNFWNDGRVVIFETDHPAVLGQSDSDLQELSVWCKTNGWKCLNVDDRLLANRHGFAYWERMYLSGIIENEQLKKKSYEEMERLEKAYLKEKEEEKNFDAT